MKGLGWLKIIVLVLTMFCAPLVMTGCKSVATATFKGSSITGATVEAAMLAWNDHLGKEKAKGTPVPLSDELKVKHAFVAYQNAINAVFDAGIAYSEAKRLNSPDLSREQQLVIQATSVLGASMANVIELLAGFGIKVN